MFKWKRRSPQPTEQPSPAPAPEKDKPLPYNLISAQLRVLDRESPLTIVDAGAHHGHTTEQYLENFPRSRVIAIEPDRENFAKAASRVASFAGRVELLRAGLSDAAGTADLHRNAYDMTHSLLELGDIRYYDEPFAALAAEKIDTVTVDGLCAERNIDLLDILKMDIQGSELKALRGASGMLARGAIRLIALEVNFVPMYRDLPTFWDIADYLRSYGYALQGMYELRHQPGEPAILCWADAIFVAPQMQVLSGESKFRALLDESLESVGGRPLPCEFLVDLQLQNGATLRTISPSVVAPDPASMDQADGAQSAVVPMKGAIVDTSSTSYQYSVTLNVSPSLRSSLRIGGLVTVEVSLEVMAGKVGIVWTDEDYHPIESTERHAMAMPGLQRVLVSVPSEKVHQLVLRNTTGNSEKASFALVGIRAKASR